MPIEGFRKQNCGKKQTMYREDKLSPAAVVHTDIYLHMKLIAGTQEIVCGIRPASSSRRAFIITLDCLLNIIL